MNRAWLPFSRASFQPTIFWGGRRALKSKKVNFKGSAVSVKVLLYENLSTIRLENNTVFRVIEYKLHFFFPNDRIFRKKKTQLTFPPVYMPVDGMNHGQKM